MLGIVSSEVMCSIGPANVNSEICWSENFCVSHWLDSLSSLLMTDEELPDYIMVMVANRRSREQMEDDLQLFLGSNTEEFTGWLHQVLQKLQEVTVANLGKSLFQGCGMLICWIILSLYWGWFSMFLTSGDMRSFSWCYCTWFKVQTDIVLCSFFLHDFALMRLENLHHVSNLCDNFWLNTIWHRWFVAGLIFCSRLGESGVTVTLCHMYGLITLVI